MNLNTRVLIFFILTSSAFAETAMNLNPTNCVVLQRNHILKRLQYSDLKKVKLKDYTFVCKTKDHKSLSCKDATNSNVDFSFSHSTDDKKDLNYEHIQSNFIFGSLNINKIFNSFSYESSPSGDYQKGTRTNVICTGSFTEI